MPFDTHDLLRQAGVTEGDFIGQMTSGTQETRVFGFTDTSYTAAFNFHLHIIRWDDYIPEDVQGHINGSIRINQVGTDESIDVRLRNRTDGEVIHETTGITSQQTVRVDTDYTPTTTTGILNLTWEWRESNGVNTSQVANPNSVVGFIL